MPVKVWYASKTFWLNILGLAVAIATLPEVGSILPEAWLPGIASVVAVLNVILRVLGGDPLGLKGTK